VRFDWDAEKNRTNQRKHAISFEEASELFRSGVNYLEIFDQAHSVNEDRFICVGPITRGVVLVVVTEPDEDVLRVISARPATRRETLMYQAYAEEVLL
jgi:uncharacterized DUF497 family protein